MTKLESSTNMKDYDFYQNRENPKHPICAAAIIVRNGKVLMGAREYEKGNPLWTLPGGRCDEGEKPEEGLIREVEEETGINDLVIVHKVGEKEGAYKDGKVPDEVHMYHCETNQDPKLLEPEKFLEWSWFDPKDLPDNLIDPNEIDHISKVIN